MSKNKSWPVLGFIKTSDLGPFLKKSKDISIEVNGSTYNVENINLPNFLTIYDKELKKEVVIGKIVTRKKDNKVVKYIQLNEDVKFTNKGDSVKSSGFAFLKSKEDRIKEINKLEMDSIISETEAEEARKQAEWSVYQVSLPPPKD